MAIEIDLNDMTEISVVVPVREENENIKPFLQRTENILNAIGESYEIIFALDPSSDNTEKVILDEIEKNKNIKLLVFSRRFGQPASTIAGILNCKSSYCVIIDVDLQDPPEMIQAAPDCGLVTLTGPVARAKLAAMVEGARMARERV